MMFCGLCQSYRMKITLLEEHSKSLELKIVQIQKINNTLLVTLKNCQDNQNWKIKYETIVQQSHELQTKIKLLAKNTSQSNSIQMYKCFKNQFQKDCKLKYQQNIRPKDLCSFQTPKRKIQRMSSQKMSAFLSTMKKKKFNYCNSAIKTYIKNQNIEKNLRKDVNTMANEKFYQQLDRHFFCKQNKKQVKKQIYRRMNNNKSSRFQQIFGQKQRKDINQSTRKTFIEILVFQ